MRLQTVKIENSAAHSTLQTNIPTENRHRFQIVATGSAFKILSDSLYTHKVDAVVREISCNAFDAHVMSNVRDKPFVVTLPTPTHPRFIVRDFGPGLSKTKFVEVYTSYFQSTKQDSNDFIGCLGLGSKTPFIMSPCFTVHSYHDGHEQVWQAFVNDTGEPDVQLISVHPSDELSGLKVVVPIGHDMQPAQLKGLCDEFSKVASRIYKWFKVPPVVTKGDQVTSMKFPYHLDPADYRAIPVPVNGRTAYAWFPTKTTVQSSEHSNTILVKMGNVVYPYNLEEANVTRFAGDVDRVQKLVKHTRGSQFNTKTHPLVLELNIGDVSVAPSREALSLSTNTEQVVLTALINGYDVMASERQKEINNAKTVYEKCNLYYSIPSIIRTAYNITVDGRTLTGKGNWDFIPSSSTTSVYPLREIDSTNLWLRYRAPGRVALAPRTTINYTMYGADGERSYIVVIDAPYKGELREWIKANFKPNESVLVVGLQDANKRTKPVFADLLEQLTADQHPRVVKMSQLKNAPAIKQTVSQLNVKLGGTVGLLHIDWAKSNNYTVGNVSDTVDVNKFVESVDADTKIYWIAAVREKDEVKVEVKGQMKRIAPWSRTQQQTAWNSGSGKCPTLSTLFKSCPVRSYKFKQVVVPPAVYKQLMELKHDRILSVDRGIEMILNHNSCPSEVWYTEDKTSNHMKSLLGYYFRYTSAIHIDEIHAPADWKTWLVELIDADFVAPAKVEWVKRASYQLTPENVRSALLNQLPTHKWAADVVSILNTTSANVSVVPVSSIYGRREELLMKMWMDYHHGVIKEKGFNVGEFTKLMQNVFKDSKAVTTLYEHVHGEWEDDDE